MTDRQIELERRFGEAGDGPVRFPPGEELLPPTPFVPELLAEVDALLQRGECESGRLELETPGAMLICPAGGSIRVNGRKVRAAELAFGDRLLVGRSLFRLERPRPGAGE